MGALGELVIDGSTGRVVSACAAESDDILPNHLFACVGAQILSRTGP